MQRPNRFAADAEGDTLSRSVWFDGENVSVYDRTQNTYARIPATGSIDTALDTLAEKYAATVPLADLLYGDPYAVLTEDVTYSKYLGLHRAAGVLCHHLVFSQPTIEWQIWIDAGEQPIPRQLVITYVREPGEPAVLGRDHQVADGPGDSRHPVPLRGARGRATRGRRIAGAAPARRIRVEEEHMARITRLPAHACLVATTLMVLLPVADAFAQRSRGSVRSTNRSAGSTRSRGTTSRTVSGNTSTRNTTAETRRGETLTGTRTVTKEGDSLNINRDVQSSSGASISKEKQVEFDDGRVESVERDVTATDRYGRTAQYSGKAEREGYGWEFEGEGKNRFGQNVEVDGYGARGYYGSGVVADVEGGRYGNRTVVAGRPYGGRAYVSQLPYGSRPYNYWGRPYYGHGGVYYRPYPIHGVVVYGYIPPPYWVYYPAPPVGAIVVTVAAASLLYSEGTYYQKTTTGGSTQYQVVPAPAGATIPAQALPPDRATITISGQRYFLFGNTFYKGLASSGTTSYIAVTDRWAS